MGSSAARANQPPRPLQPLRQRHRQAEVAADSDHLAVIVGKMAQAGATCLLPIAQCARAGSTRMLALHHALVFLRHPPCRTRLAAAALDHLAVIVALMAQAGATCPLPTAQRARAVSTPVPALQHARELARLC